jgi:prophage maintenance system killer protein
VIVLNAADLVVIAARTLGISTDAALTCMEIPAAQAALAEAGPPGQEPGADFSEQAAAAAIALVRALLRNRPFPQQNQQVAVAAGLQFLSLNRWRADLDPAATTAVVVEALASGRLAPVDAVAWLSPRLSPAPRSDRRHRVGRTLVSVPRFSPRLPRLLPAAPAAVGRGHGGWRRRPRGLLTRTGHVSRGGQAACRPAIPGGGVGPHRRPGLCGLHAHAWDRGFP